MSSNIESLIENMFAKAEKDAQKPVKGEKGKPVKDDPGVEIHFKKKSRFDPLKKAVKENVFGAMGKTTPDSIQKSGGDTSAYAKLKKGKDAEAAKLNAPVHRDEHGRKDHRAGPKGHSAKNTFERKGKRTSGADNFSKGAKSAPMSKDAINQSGVGGHTVKKDGQAIPSARWSALKGALANRKVGRAIKSAPDVN